MKFSNYFIDRPVFAAVLSAFITIAGAIALFKLPVSEYPEVVPPSVVVNAQFPGANAKVVAETVATPLEEQINGVENLLYMLNAKYLEKMLVAFNNSPFKSLVKKADEVTDTWYNIK